MCVGLVILAAIAMRRAGGSWKSILINLAFALAVLAALFVGLKAIELSQTKVEGGQEDPNCAETRSGFECYQDRELK